MSTAANDLLAIGLAPSTSTAMADMAMARSVALVLENAAVTERDVQRLEEASLTQTLALMGVAAAKGVATGG